MSKIRRDICKDCRNAWLKKKKLVGCMYPVNTKFLSSKAEKPCYKFEPAFGERIEVLIEGLTVQEVSTKLTGEGLKCKDTTVRYMLKKLGLNTVAAIRTRIIERSAGEVEATKYQVTLPDGTPALMTISEMWEIHPHKDTVSFSALSSRVSYGTDPWKPKHVNKKKTRRRKPKEKPRDTTKPKAAALKKAAAEKAKAAARRKVKEVKEAKAKAKAKAKVAALKKAAAEKVQAQKPVEAIAVPAEFDRNKACYGRNEKKAITERCRHYFDLTETFCRNDQRPDLCLAATESCDNFDGELLKPVKVDTSVVNSDPNLCPRFHKTMGGGGRG